MRKIGCPYWAGQERDGDGMVDIDEFGEVEMQPGAGRLRRVVSSGSLLGIDCKSIDSRT